MKNMIKKKLLYIVPSLKFFSEGYRGRVMHALGICEGYADNGWEVTIIGGNSLKKFRKDIPSSVVVYEISEPTNLLKYPVWWLKILRAYIKLARENNFSCLMIRYVVSSVFLIAVISILSPKKQKKILEVNSFGYHMLSKLPKRLNLFVAAIEYRLTSAFDLIYVVSQTMLSDSRALKCKTEMICVENGATKKKINFVPDNSSLSLKTRLVYLGTLMPYWNFDFLASAINNLTENLDVEIIFLGDGPELENLRNNLKQKNVIFHGRFSRNDLGYLLNPSKDILLLPPKTSVDMLLTGGLSTKLFDYLSMKMPILAPSDGEINSVLANSHNAILYKSTSVNDFYECVKKLHDDDHLRKTIALNAYFDFEEKYSWQARMNQIINKVYVTNE